MQVSRLTGQSCPRMQQDPAFCLSVIFVTCPAMIASVYKYAECIIKRLLDFESEYCIMIAVQGATLACPLAIPQLLAFALVN